MGVPSIERDGYPFFGFWKNRTRTSNSTPIYHFSFAAFEEFSKRHFTSNLYFTDSEVVLIDHRNRTVYLWCSEKPAFDCYDTSWVSDSLGSTKLRMCSKMYACIMNYTIWPYVLWLWFLIYRLLCYRDGNIQISREGTFNLHANELYILQSFVRTKTDLLELKSHVIYVLKRVVNNRWIKSNRFFLENKRLKKNAPSFEMPAKSKTCLKAARHCHFLLLSSFENYTCLVLNVSNIHALYTWMQLFGWG